MKPRDPLLKFPAICAIVVLAACSSLHAGGAFTGAEYVPQETKVLLLQPIDATVDSARLQPLRQQIIRLRQQYEFISRQFVVLGEAMVVKPLVAEPGPVLERRGGRSATALDEVARRSGADWVVSIVVTEIASDSSDSFDGATVSVHSTLLIQVRDTRRHVWLANRSQTGRMTRAASPPELFIESLDAATEEALAAVLTAYPRLVKVARDGSIVDYLEGQTAPFVGNPAKPFLGLNARKTDAP